MDEINWSRAWGERSMSLLSFAHTFCRANALTIAEFCKLTERFRLKLDRRASELIDQNLSTLNAPGIVKDHYLDWQRLSGLYVSEFTLTDLKSEISRSLRYCRTCITRGHHFTWQQLAWMENCAIHDEPLQTACICGSKIRYVLKQTNVEIGSLCQCGDLRFGDNQELHISERRRLNGLLKGLYALARHFPRSIRCLRLGRRQADPAELLRAEHILRLEMLRIIDRRTFDLAGNLHNFSHQDSNREVQREAIDRAFGELFELLDRRQSDDIGTCVSQRIASDWIQGVFGDSMFDDISRNLAVNGQAVNFDDPHVSIAAKVLAIRAISGLLRFPCKFGNEAPAFIGEFPDTVHQPLCLMQWHPKRGTDTARVWMPPPDAVDRTFDAKWFTQLCEFLTAHFLYGERGAKARLVKLRDAKAERTISPRAIGELLQRATTDQLELPI